MKTTGVFPVVFARSICCVSRSVIEAIEMLLPGRLGGSPWPAVGVSVSISLSRRPMEGRLTHIGGPTVLIEVGGVAGTHRLPPRARAALDRRRQDPGDVARECSDPPPEVELVAAALEVPPVQAGVALGG